MLYLVTCLSATNSHPSVFKVRSSIREFSASVIPCSAAVVVLLNSCHPPNEKSHHHCDRSGEPG